MFGFQRRRRQQQLHREITANVGSIQRHLFEALRRELTEEYEMITAGQLAQAVVDRLFARPAALHGEELRLVESLSNELAKSQVVRDAAFVCLEALMQLEGAHNDFRAERRIIETLDWLERFGQKPQGTSLAEVLNNLLSTVGFLKVGRQETLGGEI